MVYQSETNKDIPSDRMTAIIWPNCRGERVGCKVCAQTGFDVPGKAEDACVAKRVSSDSECAAVQKLDALFQIRLMIEKLVFIDHFTPARDEILATEGQHRFRDIRIQIAEHGGSVDASPNQRC